MRSTPVAALVLGGALMIGSCTNATSEDASSEPWSEPGATWMQPAGTPLVKGVAVPEGARLVGPVFTQFDEAKALDGEFVVGSQQGYLLVDGEPYGVATAFLDQWDGANGHGESPKGTVCRQQVEEGVEGKTHSYSYTGEAADGAVEISCTVGLIYGQRRLGDETVSQAIVMSFTEDLTDPDAPVQGTVGWQSPAMAVPETLPKAPEDVNGPTSVASDVDYLPDLKIVEGSFLAGPPTTGFGTGGYIAVIGVTGDPDEVFDAYVAQDKDEPYLTADDVIDGMRIREYRSSEAGGVTYTVTLNEIDGNAWILVEAYND